MQRTGPCRTCRTTTEREGVLETHPQAQIEELYRHNADRLLRYAQRRVAPTDAEEVVAQTFVIAWRKADQMPDDPFPWLIGIARNVIRNLQRSHRRQLRLNARVARTDVARPADHVDDDLAPITAALASLSDDDRELLTLIAWEGLDHAAAARAMGWSRANLRLRLHRARKRLRARLEATGHPFRHPTVTARPTPEEAR